MQNFENKLPRTVKYYKEDGTPVFKKKFKEVNIVNQRGKIDKIIFGIIFIIFTIHAITLFYPILWLLVNSLKTKEEYLGGSALAFPNELVFENYALAFTSLEVKKTTFGGMLFNSLWYTVIMAIETTFIPLTVGYVLSKYKFIGRNFLYTLAIVSLTIPIIGSTASQMKLVSEMGIKDTLIYPIIASAGGFSGSFLISYGFFKSMSWSYAEAAKIDGANAFKIYFSVMLPQALPISLTFMITHAIGYWNEYNTIILYMPSFPTLASGLFEYKEVIVRHPNEVLKKHYPVYYSGLVISIIPCVILFAAASSKIFTSLSIGGLKG